jgi:hypothetical protein
METLSFGEDTCAMQTDAEARANTVRPIIDVFMEPKVKKL